MKKPNCLGLTEEQFKRFDCACHVTWRTIGHDVMDTRTYAGEKGAMKRSEVIEVVLDANYLRMYGEQFGKIGDWEKFYDEVLRPWITKNYDTRPFLNLMKRVFPFGRYS